MFSAVFFPGTVAVTANVQSLLSRLQLAGLLPPTKSSDGSDAKESSTSGDEEDDDEEDLDDDQEPILDSAYLKVYVFKEEFETNIKDLCCMTSQC